MVAYAKEELVGVTEFGKSVGVFLDKVLSKNLDKIALVRRNKPEAVVVPIETYEKMMELEEYLEYEDINRLVQERVEKRKSPAKPLSIDELKSKLRQVGRNV